MAVVHIAMDTKRSVAGELLPYDVELCVRSVELLHYVSLLHSQIALPKIEMGSSVVIDSISLSNPFDIWAFFKEIPVHAVKAALNRTIFYKPEYERRSAEAEITRQAAISAKLDNIRKANEIRRELIGGEHDPENATRMLGKILHDQKATITVHDASRRKHLP